MMKGPEVEAASVKWKTAFIVSRPAEEKGVFLSVVIMALRVVNASRRAPRLGNKALRIQSRS